MKQVHPGNLFSRLAPPCNYYLIRSSVLGGKVIAEFKDLTTLPANDPLKYSSMSYIYLNGVQLAFQQGAHQTTGDKHVV